MELKDWKKTVKLFDERRDIVIPGNAEETIHFSVCQFLQIGREAIKQRGLFCVALSGGNTPHAIFQELSKPSHQSALDWSKVLCFWSDERSAPPTSLENNYYSSMQAGLAKLPLKPENIFRMIAEENIEKNALAYEKLIREKIPSLHFDLMMLGMGEDGHTASLFPHTEGLQAKDRLVIANQVPQLKTWRMSMTYECIHNARTICIYALGEKKAKMIATVLQGPYEPDQYPVQKIGTPIHKSLWILDKTSASKLDLPN